MPTPQLVVIGASAGGIEALREIARGLPDGFAAPVCIVMHTAPESPGVLHEILMRAGGLPATQPVDGERLLPGRLYVAPPDRHLLIEPGRMRVTRGPKENRFRPAIDPLFRSAAQIYGPGAIGVVLTGNLDDGTAGLWAIKQLGGIAVVQDPDEAEFGSMPLSALRAVDVDHVRRLVDIPPLLVALTQSEPAAAVSAAAAAAAAVAAIPHIDTEVRIAKEENAVDAGIEGIARPSSFACPECHGVLLQLAEGGRLRFRCHTGHAYSAESLRAAIDQGIEDALWNAFRALEEGQLFMRQLSHHFDEHPDNQLGPQFRASAEAIKAEAGRLRQLIDERVSLIPSK